MRAAMLVLAAGIATLFALAAASKPPQPVNPKLEFTPASYDFGRVTVGEIGTHDFTLTYTGKGTSGKITVGLDTSAGPFSVTASSCRGGIGANRTCKVTVQYAPESLSTADTAKLTATAGPLTATANLFGAGQAANDPPTADSQQVGVDQDTATEITLTASDPEGESIYEWAIVTAPTHGTLGWSVSNGSLCDTITLVCSETITYTPAVGFLGEDSFTFTAGDGEATSSAATVSILVSLANRAPTVDSQTGESAVVVVVNSQDNTITLTGHDEDGDDLAFGISTLPAYGTLGGYTEGEPILGSCSGTPSTCTAEITYSPDSDYVGSDSFSFYAYDGEAFSDAAADVSITVNPANTQPTADPRSGLSVSHTMPLLISLSGSDPDGDTLAFGIVEGYEPTYGTLGAISDPICSENAPSICTAEVTYTPNGSTLGYDEFTFYVADSEFSASATVTIDVTNEPPTASPPTDLSVQMNSTNNVITLGGGDPDGDDLTFVIDTGPGHGTLNDVTFYCSSSNGLSLMSTGTSCYVDVEYTPQREYSGTDTFTYQTKDGWDTSDSVTVSINVEAAPLPGLSIDSPPFVYSNNNADLTFTVTLDAASGSAVTFGWAAADDTAVWGNACDGTADYTSEATTGIGTITAGDTSTTITFGTCNNGPANVYPITTPTYFTVTISNPSGATITTDTGTGTIRIT